MESNSGVMAMVQKQMVMFVYGGAVTLPLEMLGFLNAFHTWMTQAWPTNLQSLGPITRSIVSWGTLFLTEFFGSQETGPITALETMQSMYNLNAQEYDEFVCSMNSELETIISDVVDALQEGPLSVQLSRGRILAAAKSLGQVAAQTARDTGHTTPAWFVQLHCFLLKVESLILQSKTTSDAPQ